MKKGRKIIVESFLIIHKFETFNYQLSTFNYNNLRRNFRRKKNIFRKNARMHDALTISVSQL